jgi:hypothetical protein
MVGLSASVWFQGIRSCCGCCGCCCLSIMVAVADDDDDDDDERDSMTTTLVLFSIRSWQGDECISYYFFTAFGV